MARKHRTRTIYLGKSVKDLNRPGLDTIKEVEGIAKAIILDYKKRKISYRKAISRLNLLSLVVTKAKSMKGKKRKAKKIINKYREKLMNSKSSRTVSYTHLTLPTTERV